MIDYAKYNYSVKVNVGTGNRFHMDDTELMGEALRRGGADTIVKRLPKGLDQELNKNWMPAGEDSVVVPPATKADAAPTAPGMPPAPPPTRVGRGGGRGGRRAAGAAAAPKGGGMMGGPTGMRRDPFANREAANLSGGQWQRIALARAFMRSDEADLVVFE